MTIEYHKHASGDVVELPLDAPYFQQWCDCGLVHRLGTEITDDGRVELTVHRDDRETERARGNPSGAKQFTADAQLAKETFMLDSAMEARVAARRAARRARRLARDADIIPDGTSIRVPLTLMDQAMYDSLRERYPPRSDSGRQESETHDQIMASISPEVRKLFDSTPMEKWPELIDAARRRKKVVERDPLGRETGEFTEEDTRRVLDRGTTAITTLDGVGNVTSDPYAMCRPGYRFADRSISEQAYAEHVRDLQDAWRDDATPKEGTQTPKGIWPPGGVPKNIGIVEGSHCTIDGRGGTWQAEGEFLFCRPSGPLVQPTRADAMPAAPPSRFMTNDEAQPIKDRAYEQMCADLQNAWKS
jgi:hypothetical protein